MAKSIHTNWETAPVLLSINDFSEKHPGFKRSTLRDLIWRSHHPESPRHGWDATGFNEVLVRTGRKVLIDEARFFDWLASKQEGRKEVSEFGEAKEFLNHVLADGPITAKEVRRQANEAGLAWITVRRAQSEMGIKPTKTRFDGHWEWSLPNMLKTPHPDHLEACPRCAGTGCSWCWKLSP